VSSVSAVSRRAPRPLTLVTATATVALSVALSGCVSTEQKAAWVHVEDARIIASQGPVVVWHAGREARVTRVALLRTRGRVAIVVLLHNATSHALSDLPISVGLPPPEDRSFADVWSALGGELKPSLDVVVTAPTPTGQRIDAGPPVTAPPRISAGGLGGWPPREEHARHDARVATPSAAPAAGQSPQARQAPTARRRRAGP